MKNIKSIALILSLGCAIANGAITNVNTGVTANDGTGDTLRTAFNKINTNITYLSNLFGTGGGGGGSSVLAYDGEFYYPTGSVSVPSGTFTSPTPVWMVKTNGSFYFGKDTANDLNIHLTDRVRSAGILYSASNSPSIFEWNYSTVDNASYGEYAQRVGSVRHDTSLAIASDDYEAQNSGGVIYKWNWIINGRGTNYIGYFSNGVPLFLISSNGNAYSTKFVGDGSGLTNVTGTGTGGGTVSNSAALTSGKFLLGGGNGLIATTTIDVLTNNHARSVTLKGTNVTLHTGTTAHPPQIIFDEAQTRGEPQLLFVGNNGFPIGMGPQTNATIDILQVGPVQLTDYPWDAFDTGSLINPFWFKVMGSNTVLQDITSVSGQFNGNGAGLTNLNPNGLTRRISNQDLGGTSMSIHGTTVSVLTVTNATVGGDAGLMTNMPAPGWIWNQMPVPYLMLSTFVDVQCANDETLVITNILIAATNGMKAAGWDVIMVEDGQFNAARDGNGDLVANSTHFPSGFPTLVNIAHTNSMKIVGYISAGGTCCTGADPGTPWSRIGPDIGQHYNWGFDGMVVDECAISGTANFHLDRRYVINAFNEVVFNYGNKNTNNTYSPRGMFLILAQNDGTSSWVPMESLYGVNMMGLNTIPYAAATQSNLLQIAYQNLKFSKFVGPGHYLDATSWPISGLGGTNLLMQTLSTYYMLAQPIQTSILPPTGTQLQWLTNSEAIAILKDKAVVPCWVSTSNSLNQIWVRPLGGTVAVNPVTPLVPNPQPLTTSNAVLLINGNSSSQNFTIYATNLGQSATTTISVRDPWSRAEVTNFVGSWTVSVTSSNMALYTTRASTIATNLPTDGYVLTASGDSGDAKWAPSSGGGGGSGTVSNSAALTSSQFIVGKGNGAVATTNLLFVTNNVVSFGRPDDATHLTLIGKSSLTNAPKWDAQVVFYSGNWGSNSFGDPQPDDINRFCAYNINGSGAPLNTNLPTFALNFESNWQNYPTLSQSEIYFTFQNPISHDTNWGFRPFGITIERNTDDNSLTAVTTTIPTDIFAFQPVTGAFAGSSSCIFNVSRAGLATSMEIFGLVTSRTNALNAGGFITKGGTIEAADTTGGTNIIIFIRSPGNNGYAHIFPGGTAIPLVFDQWTGITLSPPVTFSTNLVLQSTIIQPFPGGIYVSGSVSSNAFAAPIALTADLRLASANMVTFGAPNANADKYQYIKGDGNEEMLTTGTFDSFIWKTGTSSSGGGTQKMLLNQTGNLGVSGIVNGTNGFAVGTATGITTNINVLIAGGATNQLQFTKGILTGAVPQ